MSHPLEIRRERGTIDEAVAIIGYPARTVQAMAAAGRIPGAAKPGRRWTFDLDVLRRWIKQEEKKRWQSDERRPIAIGAAGSFGGVSRLPARSTDGAYARAMARLQSGASRRSVNG